MSKHIIPYICFFIWSIFILMTRNTLKSLIKAIIKEARIYTGSGETPHSISTEYELTPEEQLALKGMSPKERQKFASVKLKQARRAKGMCIQCGVGEPRNKPDGSKATYCDKCLQMFKDNRLKRTQQRQSCGRCANPPLPGKKLCQKCTNDLETLRIKALAQGLCIRCKKLPAVKNEKGRQTLFCQSCNQEKKDMERQRKFNLNLQNPSQ